MQGTHKKEPPDTSLTELVQPGRVLCNVEARSKKHALEILSELLGAGEPNLGQNEIFECLVQRERLGSTGLGDGVAIPHCLANGIDHSVAAFMKLSEPVDFDAPDGKPVVLLFGLLVPEDTAEDERARTVEELSKTFSDPAYRATLMRASRSRKLYEALVGAPAATG